MSLIGIKDMSLIEEPPEERYPVQTYVLEQDNELIRDAIQRELDRDGQVYIVYNTVANKPEAVPAPRPDYVRSTNVAPLQMGSDKITTQPARETA